MQTDCYQYLDWLDPEKGKMRATRRNLASLVDRHHRILGEGELPS
jgi:hypothetical protein